ncbi:pyrokinin-1 receptor-like [Haliotis cracherodii]|uniref:pyrokinin-1 receptor-like n=1 Tax=Haliotis cracherodii TaxID=6455 RepID=UPI0039EA9247
MSGVGSVSVMLNMSNASDIVDSNFSLDDYILTNLGSKNMGSTAGVLLTIIYSLIFISGTIGNVCTCIVIARNSYMQTTTNYYLFSLAVSDLLLLLFGLPPELYAIWESYPWRFGEAFCILRHSVMEMTSYASVLTITAFTVERYVAICRPLQAHRMAGLSRCLRTIISIWVVSILVALPFSIHTRVFHELHHPVTHKPVPESLICNIRTEWRGRMTYMFQISTFLFFVTPVAVIICLYILIGIALRKSQLGRRPSEESKYGTGKLRPPTQPKRVVIRMLVAVTVAFILCWAPFHSQRLMVLYVSTWTPLLMKVQSTLFYISGVLYFVSCTVNPILYNVISRRYRCAFKETICFCYYKRGTFSYTSSVLRGNSDKPLKQPMTVVKRDSFGQPTAFHNRNSLSHPAVNGHVPETIKTKLLDDTFDSKADRLSRINSVKDVNTFKTCDDHENGYMTSEGTAFFTQGFCALQKSSFNDVLKGNGSVT